MACALVVAGACSKPKPAPDEELGTGGEDVSFRGPPRALSAASESQIFVIQPGPGACQDTCIVSDADLEPGQYGNANFGRSPCFGVGIYDDYTAQRGLIQFSLAGLPPSPALQLESAELVLHQDQWIAKHYDDTVVIEVHEMRRAWKQGAGRTSYEGECVQGMENSPTVDGATAMESGFAQPWHSVGVGFGSAADAGAEVVARTEIEVYSDGPWSFDVTESVRAWLAGRRNNYGWLLRMSDDGLNRNDYYRSFPIFVSCENTFEPSRRPLLLVKFSSTAPS